jgi:membrane protein DedA with SNARE-associated domain
LTAGALIWYGSIFCWLFFTGIGIPPCPEEAGILYAAGVTALHPEIHWWLAWPVTSLGIVCADMVLYSIGRLWGKNLFELRWVRWILKPERRRLLEERFHTHGIKILIAARFLPPLRTGVFMIAGSIRYSFVRFLTADGIFAVIGVGIVFFCGTWLIDLIGRAQHWLVFAAAGAVGLFLLYRYYRYLRKREQRMENPPPMSILQLPRAEKEKGSGVVVGPPCPACPQRQAMTNRIKKGTVPVNLGGQSPF